MAGRVYHTKWPVCPVILYKMKGGPDSMWGEAMYVLRSAVPGPLYARRHKLP